MTTLPPRLLQITVDNVDAGFSFWPSDGTAYAGAPFQWSVTVSVQSQQHSSPNTPTPFVYNGLDVVVNDWISNAVGGFAWIIRSISSQSTSSISCVVEDVLQYNTYNDITQIGNGAPPTASGFLFSLDEAGQPILTGVAIDIITPEWQTDLMSRFAYTTVSEFTFTQATPSAIWTIVHNMNMHPSIETVDTDGSTIEGDIVYQNANTIIVTFSIAIAGFAYLN